MFAPYHEDSQKYNCFKSDVLSYFHHYGIEINDARVILAQKSAFSSFLNRVKNTRHKGAHCQLTALGHEKQYLSTRILDFNRKRGIQGLTKRLKLDTL